MKLFCSKANHKKSNLWNLQSHTSDKGLVSRIYNSSTTQQIKRQTQVLVWTEFCTQKLYIWELFPQMCLFEDRDYKEVLKVKWGHKGWILIWSVLVGRVLRYTYEKNSIRTQCKGFRVQPKENMTLPKFYSLDFTCRRVRFPFLI